MLSITRKAPWILHTRKFKVLQNTQKIYCTIHTKHHGHFTLNVSGSWHQTLDTGYFLINAHYTLQVLHTAHFTLHNTGKANTLHDLNTSHWTQQLLHTAACTLPVLHTARAETGRMLTSVFVSKKWRLKLKCLNSTNSSVNVYCRLKTVLWTLYTANCTLQTVHCKLYTTHCTL